MTTKRITRTKKIVLTLLLLLTVIMLATAVLLYLGIVQINNPSKDKYPVRGVDVSAYQGEIDWNVLSRQGIDFAYIKATEGSSFVDEQFENNWQNASETDLKIGAYHFFSLESPGKAQAEHFCRTVPTVQGSLPPVVDVEPYGEFTDITEENISELKDWIAVVEKKFGVYPIIYTTPQWYKKLFGDETPSCGVWIRSVYSKPPKDIDWIFWQYSNRMCLDGYNGEEKYIDMNLFNGSEESFSKD